jgi:hypothetical protein
MNVQQCPGCGNPLNGRECRHCDYDESKDYSTCWACGDLILEENLKMIQVEGEFGQIKYRKVCSECTS